MAANTALGLFLLSQWSTGAYGPLVSLLQLLGFLVEGRNTLWTDNKP
jgi:hypothetical protein